jgi:predicted unusual protein kinase regulating ubiquinone biosynthesis (AarF/ABC1/UbiB family)
MKTNKSSQVPQNRLTRLAHLGGLASCVAGGILAEGLRQVARGNLPRPADLVLTPSNARRVADKLAELRGAAMKVGQLLSMDAGDLLPPELAAILARLRANGTSVPRSQVVQIPAPQNWRAVSARRAPAGEG